MSEEQAAAVPLLVLSSLVGLQYSGQQLPDVTRRDEMRPRAGPEWRVSTHDGT